MSSLLSKKLELALKGASDAGNLMREAREKSQFEIGYKGKDLVTSTDLAVEKMLLNSLKQAFPEDLFLTEENYPNWDDGLLNAPGLWIIDPIDGTTNFASGHLHCAVSIAYAEHGKTQLGVVYAPFLNELFWAQLGCGAYLNQKKIKCSSCNELENSLVATGFPYDRSANLDLTVERLRRFLAKARDLRRLGAASIDACWVACGRLEAYYEDVKPWDIAAAGLIARESGAITSTTAEGAPFHELSGLGFLVACPGVHEEVRRLLKV
jgi:myo-inositol-1(or 4)-monophosphatase